MCSPRLRAATCTCMVVMMKKNSYLLCVVYHDVHLHHSCFVVRFSFIY